MPPGKKPRKHRKRNASPARVDDTLVRSYEVRQQILKTISAHQAGGLTVEDSRALAADIQQQGAPAIQAVIDCLFDDPNVQRIALMLLTEIDDPVLIEKIQAMLQRPHLPEQVRAALLAVEALHGDVSRPEEDLAPPPDVSVDSLLELYEGFLEGLEMEELAVMWGENFADEAAEDRLALLELLMQSAHPKMLGVARLEIAKGDIKILQFLAEHLGQYEDPLAARLLEDMLVHPDLVVRTLAEQSLVQLKRRSVSRAERWHEKVPARPRFYRAHLAADERTGHYSLVYAVKMPDDTIKFFVVLLERWDRGIVDCWGNARCTPEQFAELLRSMTADFADLRQKRITKGTALTYLERAMELNVRRNHPLPLELSVWMHLIENQRFRSDPDVPAFGVDCSYCRNPIRTGPRTPPLVLDDLVVCPKCSKRKLKCPVCEGATTFSECLLIREDSDDPIGLRCPHCFQSIDAGF